MKALRIIVFSDTHRNFDAMLKIFERNMNAELFIFLGDGERELVDIKCMFPQKRILSVAGNCDFASIAQRIGITVENDRKIVFLHGHSHGVKSGTERIVNLAREYNADILLFGHTHQRYYSYEDGLHILNPGSAGNPRDGKKPSYSFIDITSAGIVCNHVDV